MSFELLNAPAQDLAVQLIGVGAEGRAILEGLPAATLARGKYTPPPLFLDEPAISRSQGEALAGSDLIIVACPAYASDAPLIHGIVLAHETSHPVVLIAQVGEPYRGPQQIDTRRPKPSTITRLAIDSPDEFDQLLRALDTLLTNGTMPAVDFVDLRITLEQVNRAEVACITVQLPEAADSDDPKPFEAAVDVALAQATSLLTNHYDGTLPERLILSLSSTRDWSVAAVQQLLSVENAQSNNGFAVVGVGLDRTLGDSLELTVIGGNLAR